MLNHFNMGYSSGYPLAVGDRCYAQDFFRDFRYHQYKIGLLLERLFGTDTAIIEGMDIAQGTGHTINIDAGKAIVPFSVTIPDRAAAWALPPTTESVDITMMPVIESNLTDQAITGATTDGVTTNYVKLAYAEDDGNTRTRAKKAGTYSYEVEPSYTITVNSTAPTAYEVTLATFTSNGTTLTFLGNEDDRIEIGFDDVNAFVEVTADMTLRKNNKYLVTGENLSLELPDNVSVGDTIEIMSDQRSFITQPLSTNVINYLNKYYTTYGISGYLDLLYKNYIKLVYKGSGNYLDIDPPTKLSDPATLPAGNGYGCTFSYDGTYLAVSHATSLYITIYKRSGDTFTKLSDPATLPPSTGFGCSFSYDGTYLAVAHVASPYITIYKRSGDTFTKLSDPATLPAGNGYGCTFSYDGTYLAVGHIASPYITIYKRSGDTFTKLSDPSTLPTGEGHGCSFSYDGTYLAIGHSTTPFVTIYKRSGDTFTKLSDPATLPTGTGRGSAFSYDGTYLAVSHATSPYITIYKRSGDTFTKLSDPATLPTGTGYDCSFSYDGNYLAVAHDTSPYITIYSRSGDTFTKLTNPSTLPTGTGRGSAFSYDGMYLVVAHTTSPYVTIYKCVDTATNTWVVVDINNMYEQDLINIFK